MVVFHIHTKPKYNFLPSIRALPTKVKIELSKINSNRDIKSNDIYQEF